MKLFHIDLHSPSLEHQLYRIRREAFPLWSLYSWHRDQDSAYSRCSIHVYRLMQHYFIRFLVFNPIQFTYHTHSLSLDFFTRSGNYSFWQLYHSGNWIEVPTQRGTLPPAFPYSVVTWDSLPAPPTKLQHRFKGASHRMFSNDLFSIGMTWLLPCEESNIMLANTSVRAASFNKSRTVCWQTKSLHSLLYQVSQTLSVKTQLTLTTRICLFIRLWIVSNIL